MSADVAHLGVDVSGGEPHELPLNSPDESTFLAECTTFLQSYAPHRTAERQAFQWGVGTDAVPVFEEVDRERELEEIALVRTWRRALWQAGLGWITGPTEFGGRGLAPKYQRLFDAAAREYDVPGNGKLTVSLGMVAPTILAHATASAKDRYLRGLYDGSIIACQLFSEPDAGSDLASVTTRAVPDGAGWRLSGQKVWTSGAHYSDIGEVLCATGGDGGRHHNLTMFVVDMHAPGVTVRPLRQMTGGAAFNEVYFDDVYVSDDDRLGDVGQGWSVALTTLANERKSIGGEGFGGVGLLSADRYIQMTAALGCADDPLVRQELADLLINLRVAKLNRLRTDANQRSGRPPGPEATIGKLQLSGNYTRIAAFVTTVLGPRLIADTDQWGTYSWAAFVLGAPGMRIGGGTDEVMRNVVAERVLGLPKS
jgi:alkylation response protein AidB-like acyl-CoA dehydrogenase